MNISFYGYDQSVLSMLSNSVTKGDLVTMAANATAKKAANGELFFGLALSSDQYGTGVQTKGYIEVPYTGSLSLGYQKLVSNGNNGVKKDDTGHAFLVLTIENNTAGLLLA
jgi:hypothetical protein